jgi:hypothetical protein
MKAEKEDEDVVRGRVVGEGKKGTMRKIYMTARLRLASGATED